jgi:protein disulfide-isomerase A1
LKGKLIFVTVDNSGDSAEPVTNFFGLKDEETPKVVGFFMEKNRKYKHMSEDLSEAALLAFAKSVEDGTAHVSVR